jgi:hypothetical protein
MTGRRKPGRAGFLATTRNVSIFIFSLPDTFSLPEQDGLFGEKER